MAKRFYGVRFKPDQYNAFKKVAKKHGYTATGAFEKFMNTCIDAQNVVFAQPRHDYKAEARILAEWLNQGQYTYRKGDGEEINIRGRLMTLLPEIDDANLQDLVEENLKKPIKSTIN